MFRYWLFIGLLLIAASACAPITPAATEPQAVESGEMSEEAQADEHDNDHDEEDEHDDHEEDEHDDHDEEDEHDDHEEDEHDDHEDDDDHREHGAHEHGAANLTIAWSGNELAIDLETPAFNVLGFEYAPSSDEEKAVLDESTAALEAGDLLQLSPEAECTVTSAAVETDLSEAGDEEEKTHSDIDAAYTVECQNPDDLEALDASGLFTRFPNFETLQVQWVSDTQQSATELTADNPVVSFR